MMTSPGPLHTNLIGEMVQYRGDQQGVVRLIAADAEGRVGLLIEDIPSGKFYRVEMVDMVGVLSPRRSARRES